MIIKEFLFSWEGNGVDEVGRDLISGKLRVRVNPRYYRPTEVELLIGDPKKAKDLLGWESKISLSV